MGLKLECSNTQINPSMEIKAAGDNKLHDTAQGILLVLVCGTYDICIK